MTSKSRVYILLSSVLFILLATLSGISYLYSQFSQVFLENKNKDENV